VGLDGTVKQELTQPKGGEFRCADANGYYSNRPTLQVPWGDRDGRPNPSFACTDVTYLDGRL
jgi:hypothetical protein